MAIDDATWLACAALFPDETGGSAAASLRQGAAWFARRGIRWRALMPDNGGSDRSHRFQSARRRQRIRQIEIRP